jgi:hypothetical protein
MIYFLRSLDRYHGRQDRSLDRSKPGERGQLLEELKTILAAHLEARLSAG